MEDTSQRLSYLTEELTRLSAVAKTAHVVELRAQGARRRRVKSEAQNLNDTNQAQKWEAFRLIHAEKATRFWKVLFWTSVLVYLGAGTVVSVLALTGGAS
jgi:hypothetical protein